MKTLAKVLTLSGMLATVAWFFWNPTGWIFEWEPIVVFLLALAGFISTEISSSHNIHNAHPNDVNLFNEFISLLPSENIIEFLKTHDFLGEFTLDTLMPIRIFINQWDNATHEFQDNNLEKLRKELLSSANDFSYKISKYTSPNDSGWQAVRVDKLKGIDKHEKRFEKEAKILNEAADVVVNKHQELVRQARKICYPTR